MAVKKGYKQTEVGVIPEDWGILPVRSLGRVLTGNTPSTAQPENYGADYMFVSPFDLGEKKYVVRTEKMLSKRGFSLARPLPSGTVLFVCIGSTIGKCGIAAASLATNQQINSIIAYDATNAECLHYSLCLASKRIKSQAGEQAVPIVNKTQFAETLLPFPPTLVEQEAIAGALSDADAWIDSLEQLIAKKRQIKQGAMQELLTGKRRLPGFSGEWEVSTVGHEFEIKLGKMLDAQKNFGVSKPFIGNRAVQWERIDINDLATVPMSPSDIERFRLQKGDLLVCEGGEVGRAAIWDAPISECYYQKALHRLRPVRGFSSRLMVGLLRLWSDRGVFSNFVTQTSIAHLPREKFMEMPLPVPTPPEQIAIADVLAEIDAEIRALESKLVKAREIKQGMMQELLTGRIRLV